MIRALVARDTWRATVSAMAAAAHAVVGGSVALLVVILWGSAAYSLISGPAGPWWLITVFVVATLSGPSVLLWLVPALGALQRIRLRSLTGTDIDAPPSPTGRTRILGPWRAASTWRQLAYHAYALTIGTAGAVLVAGAWTAPVTLPIWGFHQGPATGSAAVAAGVATLFAAPRVARAISGADIAVATVLLGPGRTEQLTRQVQQLSRSRAEVVAATDAERRRIERDLHDGLQQRLVSLAMNLGLARAAHDEAAAGGEGSAQARLAIEHAHDEAVLAMSELREFVRGLHPAVLNDRGLDAALSGIAARATVPVRLRVDVEPRCPSSIEAIAYFTVSEALTNVARHADARHTEVTVWRAGNTLHIVVRDDGRGGATLPTDGGIATGLRGLAQRAAAVDGTLRLESPVGGPTTVTVELPCE